MSFRWNPLVSSSLRVTSKFITNCAVFHSVFLRHGILQLIRRLLHSRCAEYSDKASSILLSLTTKSFKLFANSLDKALLNELRRKSSKDLLKEEGWMKEKEKRNEKDNKANNEPTVTKEELLRRLLICGVGSNLVGVLASPTATDIAKMGAAGALLNLNAAVWKKKNGRRYGGGG
ncbi:uncharacterized protein MONOS_15760 [Monocercomonoides exilis]|uniref:uncharacterized protein n=1 Tax=Monocercomonoides exilis TaxID=2049356 RepID=UPI00355AA0BC|nr:hypothetical protein MONOS_15760 [Monocercomonoides exilis]|eukprot:MONOS_15760.1-p1 / transcript=MONOS_15760.1 / gene=MONOS_15760 / organism=Monocercomonoides_exilis_PA203 / gene_product=unspecified product / transcript_product=unspecified product / location=Mono_scaffold01344:4719-5430(+) / protein_length=175 / sequence_SO=supercontig / SO=protein_coding / is_pseudo=false